MRSTEPGREEGLASEPSSAGAVWLLPRRPMADAGWSISATDDGRSAAVEPAPDSTAEDEDAGRACAPEALVPGLEEPARRMEPDRVGSALAMLATELGRPGSNSSESAIVGEMPTP